jgi:hypothetical protein
MEPDKVSGRGGSDALIDLCDTALVNIRNEAANRSVIHTCAVSRGEFIASASYKHIAARSSLPTRYKSQYGRSKFTGAIYSYILKGGKTGDVRQESEASLIAESLVMPPVIKVFDRSSIMLRGDDSKSESFSVTSPYSAVISSDRPIFRWTALSGASSYVVSVYDARLNLISASEPVVETQWLMPGRLKREPYIRGWSLR